MRNYLTKNFEFLTVKRICITLQMRLIFLQIYQDSLSPMQAIHYYIRQPHSPKRFLNAVSLYQTSYVPLGVVFFFRDTKLPFNRDHEVNSSRYLSALLLPTGTSFNTPLTLSHKTRCFKFNRTELNSGVEKKTICSTQKDFFYNCLYLCKWVVHGGHETSFSWSFKEQYHPVVNDQSICRPNPFNRHFILMNSLKESGN